MPTGLFFAVVVAVASVVTGSPPIEAAGMGEINSSIGIAGKDGKVPSVPGIGDSEEDGKLGVDVGVVPERFAPVDIVNLCGVFGSDSVLCKSIRKKNTPVVIWNACDLFGPDSELCKSSYPKKKQRKPGESDDEDSTENPGEPGGVYSMDIEAFLELADLREFFELMEDWESKELFRRSLRVSYICLPVCDYRDVDKQAWVACVEECLLQFRPMNPLRLFHLFSP